MSQVYSQPRKEEMKEGRKVNKKGDDRRATLPKCSLLINFKERWKQKWNAETLYRMHAKNNKSKQSLEQQSGKDKNLLSKRILIHSCQELKIIHWVPLLCLCIQNKKKKCKLEVPSASCQEKPISKLGTCSKIPKENRCDDKDSEGESEARHITWARNTCTFFSFRKKNTKHNKTTTKKKPRFENQE